MSGPFDLYQVLEKEYVTLHGPLPYKTDDSEPPTPGEARRRAEQRLAAVCAAIHKRAGEGKRRSALCFSGGGIRSATFGLGVLQGLARRGLLQEFDYLSTVSGGGYLGGWFSAWLKREADRVRRDRDKDPALRAADEDEAAREISERAVRNIQGELTTPPAPKLVPEPEPVRHLRSYSNYMSPRLGLLSADTWTLAAIYFRNLFLNWLVLVPLILGVLAVPRFSLLIAGWRAPGRVGDGWLQAAFWAAVACGVFAISYIIANRPSVADDGGSRIPDGKRSEGWFLVLCMTPLLLLSRFIASYWAWLRVPSDALGYRAFGYALPHNALAFALFGVTLYLGAYFVARIFLVRREKSLRLEWLVAVVTGALGGLLTYLMAAYVFDNPVGAPEPGAAGVVRAAAYVCLAAPTFLLLFLAASTIFVGLYSRRTTDADREWLARCGAWVLITAAVWVAVSSVSLFGPVLLFYFGPKLLTAVGSAAGLVTVGGAASGRTAANKKEETKEDKSAWAPLLKSLALSLAAPVFAVFLLVVFSLLMTCLAKAVFDALAGASWVPGAVRGALSLTPINWDGLPKWGYAGPDGKAVLVDQHGLLNVAYYLPGWFLFSLMLLVVAVGVGMGFCVNINKFSLHGAYRDRLIRAYLGASRLKRERRPNPFTGFDQGDNIGMSALAARPLHVVNMTLNLVSLSSEQLGWQDRKAESFTASRLFCGSFCIPRGYRGSEFYGYDKGARRGISLGTAVAISGAAASPNMGYYSSTFVTFLLSLFNVRLGWWLGNPGEAGGGTWNKSGPTFGPRALVAETLGWTDDRHPYVYLSDGGHFENLGLYEMVLRRCHLIVVSDGSADPSLTFNDLGNAISKIRDDLGIPVVFEDLPIAVRPRDAVRPTQSNDRAEKYAAVGRICYSKKDAGAVDGVIVYLKPNVYGGEPADVFNYAKSNPAFPHESTGDQMYSEAQFESYRMLGQHVVEAVCKGEEFAGLEAFQARALEYLGRPGAPVTLPGC